MIVISVLSSLELKLECPFCAIKNAFKLLDLKARKAYDLDDSNLKNDNLTTMQIRSSEVLTLVMRCATCGEHVYVFPSFIIQGTTVTLRAILFVTMLYESSLHFKEKCTWRHLTDTIRGNTNIPHSVLYKAVHALGQTIESDQEMQRLMLLYPEIFPQTEEVKEAWPPEKSIKKNTKKRELGARRILTDVYQTYCKDNSLFGSLLGNLQEKIAGIFTNFGIVLATLYPLAQNA